jgi:vaccinia related kinase
VLEYIHGRTYVHADIKGANLLLDLKTQTRVFLVDFGLASHFTTKDEYKLDPKKAHNGTIEYTSRDAHMGGKAKF